MSSTLIIGIIACFFLLLIAISFLTGKQTDNDTFFTGKRQSPWYIVSIGMIGASLSGVTFVSVPGMVGKNGFLYMQMVLGYLLGYFVIAQILMPLFYRLNVISIYTYLEKRFGIFSYKTGASLFLLSKTVGAAARLYLMANVLQISLFDAMGVPFWVTVTVTILLIWVYTHRAGVKTIIYTDTLQAIVMVAAVILAFITIASKMDLSFFEAVKIINDSEYSKMFEFSDWGSQRYFIKQFLTGAFITIVMTGLDQDMMQKNLSCRNLKEGKLNMYSYALALVPVNLIFLTLGAMLYIYAAQINMVMPEKADDLFAIMSTSGVLPPVVGILFILGLIAAAYSSADSALASLTTSFSIDILNISKMSPLKANTTRRWVHVGVSVVMGCVILIFNIFKVDTIINTIFNIAGYTYGPLLGLFAFGLFTKWHPRDWTVLIIAIIAPVITGIIDYYSISIFGSQIGNEKLLLNGAITFVLLALASINNRNKANLATKL